MFFHWIVRVTLLKVKVRSQDQSELSPRDPTRQKYVLLYYFHLRVRGQSRFFVLDQVGNKEFSIEQRHGKPKEPIFRTTSWFSSLSL